MSIARHSAAGLSALALAPLGAAALLVKPGWRTGLGDRLGLLGKIEPGRLWIHAASVGEVRAAAGLVEELWSTGEEVFGSSSTPAGREAIGRSWPQTPGVLAPIDHPWCVDAALERVRPRALVLVETELWPCWIAAASRRNLPVVIVSGRLSDRSFPRYWRLRHALGRTWRRIRAVGARTALDAERFKALGIPEDRVFFTGDLKLDPRRAVRLPAADLERSLRRTPYFVAGSTHLGEEAAALQALEYCEKQGLALSLVLAPRYPERVAAVEKQLIRAGRQVRRRTTLAPEPLEPGEVLLLDTLGELPGLYANARVAFVGGTLRPVGGHNVMEPVQAGCPVLFGPHVENVRRAVELLEDSGAGSCVGSPSEFGEAVARVLLEPEAAKARAERGRSLLAEHRGSVERTLGMLREVLGIAAVGVKGGAASNPAAASKTADE